MFHDRIYAILCAAGLTVGCTRSEPSLVPLGYGLLSRAEREAEAARPMARPSTLRDSVNARSDEDNVDVAAAPASSVHAEPQDRSARVDAGTTSEPTPSSKERPSQADLTSLEDWLDLFRGNDTTIFKTPDQSDRRFEDSKAKIRVERASRNHLTFALVDSSNDKDICKLSGLAQGDTATIEAGQSCFLDPDESMTVKSRPGKATLTDRRLIFDLVLDTILDTDIGQIDGTIEYHFDGRR